MKALGLRTTIYKVPDLTKAKEWYSKVFNTQPYFDEPFYIGFDIGGYELGLTPGEVEGKKTENVFSYWGVEDIESAYQELIKNGASEFKSIMDVGDGIKVASLKDPWDNLVGIIYNPHFSLAN